MIGNLQYMVYELFLLFSPLNIATNIPLRSKVSRLHFEIICWASYYISKQKNKQTKPKPKPNPKYLVSNGKHSFGLQNDLVLYSVNSRIALKQKRWLIFCLPCMHSELVIAVLRKGFYMCPLAILLKGRLWFNWEKWLWLGTPVEENGEPFALQKTGFCISP